MKYTVAVRLQQHACIDIVREIGLHKALSIGIKVTDDKCFAHALLELLEGFFAFENPLEKHRYIFFSQSIQ